MKWVKGGMINLPDPVKSWIHKRTYDKSKEYTLNKEFFERLGCEVYFVNPYEDFENFAGIEI